MRNTRPVECFLVDVLIFIDRIKRYTKNLNSVNDLEQCDEVIFDATMRAVELLGEALKHVLTCSELEQLIDPEWRIIVDFRNIVAHGYFGIDNEEVFNAIKIDLPLFEEAFIHLLQKLKNNEGLQMAFADAHDELVKKNKHESLAYLTAIERRL